MASILEALDIDTILFLLPSHMAVGVYCTSCSGAHYEYNGRSYYYLETTGEAGGWQIGQIPEAYDLSRDVQKVIEVN